MWFLQVTTSQTNAQPLTSTSIMSPQLPPPLISTPSSSQSSHYPCSSKSSLHTSSRDALSPEMDDTMSVASSSSSVIPKREFTIPHLWRPSIMECINATSLEEQKRRLTPTVRGEISRDLVTQMHAFKTKPDRSFCNL